MVIGHMAGISTETSHFFWSAHNTEHLPPDSLIFNNFLVPVSVEGETLSLWTVFYLFYFFFRNIFIFGLGFRAAEDHCIMHLFLSAHDSLERDLFFC